MAIVVEQIVAFNNGFSGAFASPVADGNTILMLVSGHGSGGACLSHDPLYNSSSITGATKILESVNGTTDASTAFWILPAVSGSHTTLSITNDHSDSADYVGVIALEVSGLGPTPTVDSFNSGKSTSSSASSGSTSALSSTPAIIFGSVTQDGTTDTPSGSWTSNTFLPGNASKNTYAGYQIITSGSGTYAYTGTGGSSDWSAGVIAVIPGGLGTDTTIAYATTATDLGGGSGSWTNVTNAQGSPDASSATWTAP